MPYEDESRDEAIGPQTKERQIASKPSEATTET